MFIAQNNVFVLFMTGCIFWMPACASIQSVPIPPSAASYSEAQRQEMCSKHKVTHHKRTLLPDLWEYHQTRYALAEMTPTFVLFPESREKLEQGLQWQNELMTYWAVAGGVGLLSLGVGIGDLATNGSDKGLPLWLDGGLMGFGVGMIATAIYVHVMMRQDPHHELAQTYNASLCGTLVP